MSMWALIGVLGLTIAGALLIGTPQTWELLVGLESPSNEQYPILAWPISIIGYFLVPAIIGLVVGMSADIQVGQRLKSYEDQIIDLRKALRLPPDPGSGGSSGGPTPPGHTP